MATRLAQKDPYAGTRAILTKIDSLHPKRPTKAVKNVSTVFNDQLGLSYIGNSGWVVLRKFHQRVNPPMLIHTLLLQILMSLLRSAPTVDDTIAPKISRAYQLHRRAALRPLIFLAALLSLGPPPATAQASRQENSINHPASKAQRPNIIIILIDDSGFSDAAAFGGAVNTPHLDRLVADGLRYNQFHTTGICTATRASLLSGLNHHHAGFGTLSDTAGNSEGYNGRWKKNVPSVAAVLHSAGYSTAAIGKWHNTPWKEITPVGPFDRWPTGLGFDYFYGFMQPGASSQWDPHSLYLNTTPVEPVSPPGGTYHMTTDLADHAIDWVRMHQSLAPDKPYFLYLATGAVHFPHHAPTAWIEKYRGKFDQGWDEYRKSVFARQKELGVVPPDTVLTPRPSVIPAWDSLSADQRRFFAHEMEVYAGFVSHTDHEIGRFLSSVQAGPGSDNTLIFYIVGDNGGSAGAGAGNHLKESLAHIDEMGGPNHLNGIEAGWAWAVSTPFQWWKGFASHFGATRNPLVVSWPARIKARGQLRTQFTHVNDIAATIYDCVGVDFPKLFNGWNTIPLDGKSFAESFDDGNVASRHRTQYFEMFGNRAIYSDGWVAAARHTRINYTSDGPDSTKRDVWELYHVANDYSEARNLAEQNPSKLSELKQLFDAEARRNDVYPLGERGAPVRSGLGYGPNPKSESIEFYPDLPRLLGIAAPNFVRSHQVSAEVNITNAKESGVLVSWGCRWSGFVLFVQDGHLVFENNDSVRGLTRLVSPNPLPNGNLKLGWDYEARTPGVAHWGKTSTGTLRLHVNDQSVGETTVSMEEASAFWGSFGVGQAFGSPVSPSIHLPFPFSGKLTKVTVRLD